MSSKEETNKVTKFEDRFPAEKYNLLVPMKTITRIAELHKLVMNAVQISTDLKDKEIYLQDKRKSDSDGWALTKKGLNKLMRAAGIKILNTRPVIPSTCQKCAEVNKSIGRPVSCGACGNKDVKFECRISVPQLTGENVEVVAHKEIIVEDVINGMTSGQITEFLKYRNEMCETKAINRALRAAMHIKGTYSLEELKKPFVVAYLVPNLDNDEVKQEAIKHFFSSSQELYGNKTMIAKKTILVENDSEEVLSHNDLTGQTIMVEESDSKDNIPLSNEKKGKDIQKEKKAPICCECGAEVTEGVARYSNKTYGKILCMDCQKKQGE